MKIFLDTDIGDDIDDAFALDLALKRNLDLVGVTTVFRNTLERAEIAKKLLALYGKQVPVYAGYGQTLAGGESTANRLCQWTEDLENYAPDASDPEEAVNAILEAGRRYGSELTLVAIGPFTNVARAILKDGEIMRKIGRLVLMGGDFSRHYASWNVRCDAEAAQTVFSSGMNITAFGADFTSAVRLTDAEMEYVFSMNRDPYHAYLSELSRLWYASKRQGTKMELHDLLAVLDASDPAFSEKRKIRTVVETKGKWTRGITLDLSRMEGISERGSEIEIACGADLARFRQKFMEGIGFMKAGKEEIQ